MSDDFDNWIANQNIRCQHCGKKFTFKHDINILILLDDTVTEIQVCDDCKKLLKGLVDSKSEKEVNAIIDKTTKEVLKTFIKEEYK